MKTPANVSLLIDLYELTMAASYFEKKRDNTATFDLFVRQMPPHRSYLVAAGLEDALDYIENLKFDDAAINYLKGLGLFKDDFLGFLKNFKFKGNVWALPEGTVFFPNEPLLRVTAPLIDAQLIESALLNTINIATTIASKAARVVGAAGGACVYDFSLRRAHGLDAGLAAARSSFIAGCRGTSNCLAGFLYGIPVVGTMAHSFVMSFPDELASFNAFAETFPERSILLVDTYDTVKGIENAVKTAKRLEKEGHRLRGIRLDSGDIVKLSKIARKILDRNRLTYARIFASGDLDEYKIRKLIKRKAKVDDFGVGTNMGTSIDAPSLDAIYKVSEVSYALGKFMPAMKLSKGKVTYPGRKQVYRLWDKKGLMDHDVLGLESEEISGQPLLKMAIDRGTVVYQRPSLPEIQEYTRKNLALLPDRYKKLKNKKVFPVKISRGLADLTKELSRELKGRSRKQIDDKNPVLRY